MQPDRPLVPGVFRSIRVFQVRDGLLLPITRGSHFRPYPVWHESRCMHRINTNPNPPAPHDPDKIDARCTCGFHSFCDLPSALSMCAQYITLFHMETAIGVVENAGRVLHHSNGLRSERMRINAIRMISRKDVPAGLNAGAGLSARELHYDIWGSMLPTSLWEQGFRSFDTMRKMLETFPLSPPPEGCNGQTSRSWGV